MKGCRLQRVVQLERRAVIPYTNERDRIAKVRNKERKQAQKRKKTNKGKYTRPEQRVEEKTVERLLIEAKEWMDVLDGMDGWVE